MDTLSGYSCIQDFIYVRLCNTHLLIEKGRWLGIPRHERVYRLCNAIQLGDEFHYLFSCPFFQDSRRTYIGHVNCSNPSIFTFKKVMSESNLYKLKWVCYCVSVIHKTKDAYRPQNSTLQTFRHVGAHSRRHFATRSRPPFTTIRPNVDPYL